MSYPQKRILISLFLLGYLVVGCDSSGSGGEEPVPVARVEVSINKDIISKGQAVDLDVIVTLTSGETMTDPSLTWSSSNESVLTVSQSGTVRGVAEGVATVTGSIRGRSSQLEIRVLDLTGTWRGTSATPGSGFGSQQTITLELVQEGTRVTGTYTNSQFTRPDTQAGIGPIEGQVFFDRFGHTVNAEMGCLVEMQGAYIATVEAPGDVVLDGAEWDGLAECAPREFTWPMGDLRRVEGGS